MQQIIPKSLQSTCGSPPVVSMPTSARSDTKTTTAANSTSRGAKPRRKFGRLSDSRRDMYLFPTITGGQVSALVVFSHVSEIQRVCGPNDNPESVPPHLETRAWQKIKVLLGQNLSKKTGEIKASSSSRCRYSLVENVCVDAGEAKWPRDQGRTPFLLAMLPERRVRHQTTAKRRHVGGMTCWMPGSWKADTRILRERELLSHACRNGHHPAQPRNPRGLPGGQMETNTTPMLSSANENPAG